MSSDRLLRAARAAGYAMACDDAAPLPAAKPAAPAQPVARDAGREQLPALVPAQIPTKSERIAQQFLSMNWGFWKTA